MHGRSNLCEFYPNKEVSNFALLLLGRGQARCVGCVVFLFTFGLLSLSCACELWVAHLLILCLPFTLPFISALYFANHQNFWSQYFCSTTTADGRQKEKVTQQHNDDYFLEF